MKIAFLLLVMAMLAVSCKKSNSPPPPHQNTLSASVNGAPFVPTRIKVLISGATPGKDVGIFADDASGRSLFIDLYAYDANKSTFNLDGSFNSFGSFCSQDCDLITATDSNSSGIGGEFKITSFVKRTDGEVITGTFQFDQDGAKGKSSITNGHFSLLVPIN
jgi:hypothetical protein